MGPSTEQLLAEISALRAELAAREACAACQALSARSAAAHRATTPPKPPSTTTHPPAPAPSTASTPPAATAADPAESSGSVSSPREILSHCSDVSAAPRPRADHGAAVSARKAGVRKPGGGRGRRDRTPAAPKAPGQSRYWTPDEHRLFLEALNRFGHKDLKAISGYVGSRNMTQVRTHSQKYFMRLMREAKRQNPVDPTVSEAGDVGSEFAALITDGEAGNAATRPSSPAAEPGLLGCEEAGYMSAATSAERPEATSAERPAATSAERPASIDVAGGDKYSVPSTCGMTLLCLVGQDTLTST